MLWLSLDIRQRPALVEELFGWAVPPKIGKPSSARERFDPVYVIHRRLGPKMNVD
jgi:hypothetical protein